MDSRTFTVQQIFQDRRQYRVPFYQRPYVWNREDQWERLWEDVRDKAEARLLDARAVPHFMGAVVLEPQQRMGLMGVERHHIIDGQQRLTTLQYMLTALAHTLREVGQEKLLPLIEQCLSNPNPETMEDEAVERFKVWPTFRDRREYIDAMTAESVDELRRRFPESFTQAGRLRRIGIHHPPALEATLFFRDSMLEWVREANQGSLESRVGNLASAVLTDLSIVCISLGPDDDAQVIFETLNAHGVELNATDLIRNFIFMRAGMDADDLYNNLWAQFEAPVWSEPQSRGRLNRPRLEWFVQSAVQAQTGDEIDIGRLYAGYRRFVDGQAELRQAAAQLAMLDTFAEHYKALVLGAGDAPIAVFGRRVAAWDASPTHALALRVAALELPGADQQEVFDSIESYLVRRAVCGLSKKNYNKVFAQLLKKMIDGGLTAAGLRESLAALQGEASRWPTDEEFRHHWLEGPLYPGRLDAAKLRSLFHRLETAMRSEMTEERVPLAFEALDIDHILPQSWYAHWPLSDGSLVSEDEAKTAAVQRFLGDGIDERTRAVLAREDAVPRIGNLTLVHYGVNRGLQNRSFIRKRESFFEHSNLHLNRSLMRQPHWDESSIADRGEALWTVARGIWPGPNN
ncbi:MAG: hypothetical protein AMXMBFR72_11780 [Betaproteobacteria bacterium]